MAAAAATKFSIIFVDVDSQWPAPIADGFTVAANMRCVDGGVGVGPGSAGAQRARRAGKQRKSPKAPVFGFSEVTSFFLGSFFHIFLLLFFPLFVYRSSGPNTGTAIIAMSGRTNVSEAQLNTCGFNDIVFKPLNKEAFLSKVNQWRNQQVRIERGGKRGDGRGRLGCIVSHTKSSRHFFFIQQTSLQLDLSQIPILDAADFGAPDFLGIQDMEMSKSARVLVVEDCTLTQHVICTLLKELTDDVTQVCKGTGKYFLTSHPLPFHALLSCTGLRRRTGHCSLFAAAF